MSIPFVARYINSSDAWLQYGDLSPNPRMEFPAAVTARMACVMKSNIGDTAYHVPGRQDRFPCPGPLGEACGHFPIPKNHPAQRHRSPHSDNTSVRPRSPRRRLHAPSPSRMSSRNADTTVSYGAPFAESSCPSEQVAAIYKRVEPGILGLAGFEPLAVRYRLHWFYVPSEGVSLFPGRLGPVFVLCALSALTVTPADSILRPRAAEHLAAYQAPPLFAPPGCAAVTRFIRHPESLLEKAEVHLVDDVDEWSPPGST